MIWSLQLCRLCRKTTAISLCSRIHTSTVLFARRRIPRLTPYEPGVRHYEEVLQNNPEISGEFQNSEDIDDDFKVLYPNKAYDIQVWKEKSQRKIIRQKIIAKKFFAPRPQPLMLTWNERQCIKYLHNEDPVQWTIKTLSESFPATPDTIKKIIKSRKKISPERAKLLDLIAQKNWELLAEGKLDADPHVLEHLKKFVNRREVLLEQINNINYLPEVKKEPVWNQGEMNKIIIKYDEALSKLAAKAQQNENLKTLSDGISEKENMKDERKSNLNLIQEKIENKMKCRKEPELKDSVIFGKMINAFKQNVTLEELENTILRKADEKKKLDLIEKAVLESKLGVKHSENSWNINKTNNHKEYSSTSLKSAGEESSSEKTPDLKKNSKLESKNFTKIDKSASHGIKTTDITNLDKYEFKQRKNEKKLISSDNKSQFTDETGVGKLLNADVSLEKTNITEDKPEIDFSDPVILQNEKIYYDQQVSDIKNTAFWNNNRRSLEKATAESNKESAEVPVYFNDAYIYRTAVLSTDVYPERIKIPKDKQGSGLTFKVKDCYYDDDGKFLYRVPGMIK